MSIRPPRPVRPARDTDQWREVATVSVVALTLVVFGFRAVLALLEIHTWTMAWNVVAIPSGIVIVPLEQWSVMERSIAGHLNIAEALSLLVVCAVSMVVLSSLANRRR